MYIKNWGLRWFVVFIFSLCFISFSISQEVVGAGPRYFKKTITYYDMALIADSGITSLPSDFTRRYLSLAVALNIVLPRFFWESLPEVTILKFSEVAKMKRYRSVEEISEDVQKYLAPELVKILDLNKEIKALQLVSEADRNRFISDKAKTLGIDAEKLEKVMNSGYIAIPFISKFTSKRDTIEVFEDKKKVRVPGIRVNLEGGLAFFRVNFVNNEYSVKLAYEVKDNGSGFAAKGITSPIDSASVEAINKVVLSFSVAVKEIFKLSAPIISAGFNSVWFDLGKREGIYVDDGFDVFEFVETSDGRMEPRNVGFVRVTEVADNTRRRNASKAQIIIGSMFGSERIVSGMFVEERPRFPFDIVFGFGVYPVKLTAGDWKFSEFRELSSVRLPDNDTLKIKKGKLLAYAARINLNNNIGRYSGVPQLWSTIDANVGILPVDIKFFGNDVKFALFGSFNLGLLKKLYFRRLALTFELKGGISNFEFGTDIKEGSDSVRYALSLRNWAFGMGPGVGFEFVINPDINIGGKVLYWFTGTSEEWSFLRKVGDDEKRWKIKFSSVHMRGFVYQVYLNVSIKNFAKVRKLEK